MPESVTGSDAHDEPFDFITLSPQAARIDLLRRELQAERQQQVMARQLLASRQAACDVLRFDHAIARQARGTRVRNELYATFGEHRRLPAKLLRGLFLPNWYAHHHAGRCGERPAAHYYDRGLAEDWAPNPFFDPAWYRARYMTDPGTGPHEPAILHYCRIGARHALAPGPLFDPVAYLRDYPEISGTPDPLYDLLVRGLMLGRQPTPMPLPPA